MNTKLKTAAAVMATAALLASPAMADSPGQLAGGPQVYKVRNVTQNGTYANSLNSVACGDEVKYSVTLQNTEFGALTNIVVTSTLGSTSTATATTDLGGTTGTTGTATVVLASGQTLSYENGSTVLYDGNGTAIKTLGDGITAGGVNVGTLNGSTTEFVNFKAKVNCPTPPVTPPTTPPVTPPATPSTPAPATQLPDTGAEAGLAGIAGTGLAGYTVMQYRRSRKAVADMLRGRK